MSVAYHIHDCNHHSHDAMHRLLVANPMRFYYNFPHCLENNCMMIADRMMDQTFLQRDNENQTPNVIEGTNKYNNVGTNIQKKKKLSNKRRKRRKKQWHSNRRLETTAGLNKYIRVDRIIFAFTCENQTGLWPY